ncbi:MAG: DUF4395 domain-containing protein [Campylobacterota bacterium]|nr:DUF4395 domain-containing protein [Campylobacterota bacterium]
MNNKSCPISLISVDSNIARINAFLVGVVFMAFIFTSNVALVYFLILDFTTRIFFNKEYSLLHIISKKSKELLSLKTQKVDIAPKKLAALFGLTFLLAIAAAHSMNLVIAFYILSTVLLACIFFEVVFSYCLGCEIYHLYKKLFV